jgi:hypothetical protein
MDVPTVITAVLAWLVATVLFWAAEYPRYRACARHPMLGSARPLYLPEAPLIALILVAGNLTVLLHAPNTAVLPIEDQPYLILVLVGILLSMWWILTSACLMVGIFPLGRRQRRS